MHGGALGRDVEEHGVDAHVAAQTLSGPKYFDTLHPEAHNLSTPYTPRLITRQTWWTGARWGAIRPSMASTRMFSAENTLSLSHTHSHTHSFSLSHTHIRSLSLTHTHFFSLSLTITLKREINLMHWRARGRDATQHGVARMFSAESTADIFFFFITLKPRVD